MPEKGPSCPVCKTTMEEASWPLPNAGVLLIANGVLFLLVFAWFSAGALVAPQESASGGDVFLLLFRRFLPLLLGLACLAWGWLALTGRRSLGSREPVWLCPSCQHADPRKA